MDSHRLASSACNMGNCMESESVIPLDNQTFDGDAMKNPIDVYFFKLSVPSRAALLLVKALNIKHNVKIVNILQNEQMSPEFIKLNPMHTVPTIDDNGFVLWDSNCIMKYLVDQYAKDDSLNPKNPKKGAIVNQCLFFNATVLVPRFEQYSVPVLVNEQPPDHSKAEKFEEALAILETFLQNRTYIAGEFITIADFAIISVIATAEAVNFKISKYKKLTEWYQRTKNAMSGFGYEEVNQAGADAYGNFFKSKLK